MLREEQTHLSQHLFLLFPGHLVDELVLLEAHELLSALAQQVQNEHGAHFALSLHGQGGARLRSSALAARGRHPVAVRAH